MRLSVKMLLYNLFTKGLILLAFLMASPFIVRKFAIENTNAELKKKREQVLTIIRQEGMSHFLTDEEYNQGFGSYNILKEEYILLDRVAEYYPLDSIYNVDRILDNELLTYRISAQVFEFENEYYLLEIGKSLETIKSIERIIFRITISIYIIFLLITFLLDSFFNKYLIRPFNQIIRKKISLIHAPQQFPYEPIKTSTLDFKILDEAITEMMKRIQKAFNQERVFISHASHELKTPVSILQTQLESFSVTESTDDKQMQKIMSMLETVQKFKKTINSLLLLSKVNNAQFVKDENLELSQLIEELFEEWKDQAEDKSIELTCPVNQPFQFRKTNESLCKIMIQNALVNAIKYTGENGKITILGESYGSGYQITISDTGPGISKKLMSQVKAGTVFLKDANTDKSGYGLQILYKIALYLNVEIEIKSTSTGTKLFFNFPDRD